jgi:hypothetical protein
MSGQSLDTLQYPKWKFIQKCSTHFVIKYYINYSVKSYVGLKMKITSN